MNRAAKRQTHVEYSAVIKASERSLYWIAPLSDWLNVLQRGGGIARLQNYHYHPKVCYGHVLLY